MEGYFPKRYMQRRRDVHPVIRVYTFGKFSVERLDRLAAEQIEIPRYTSVSDEEWGGRNHGRYLLNLLLCSDCRRAPRDILLETLWPDTEKSNADRYLNAAAWILRRVLRSPITDANLLRTQRPGNDLTIYELAGQQELWVDTDEFLGLLTRAEQEEQEGGDPLPLLEQAQCLIRGEFLLEDIYHSWADQFRQSINAACHRCLYWLADLYEQRAMLGKAENLFHAALKKDVSDEDVLYRLMQILACQGRAREALSYYERTKRVLHNEQHIQLLARTQALAEEIQTISHSQEKQHVFSTMHEAHSARKVSHSSPNDQQPTPVTPTSNTSFAPSATPFSDEMKPVDWPSWFGLKQCQIFMKISLWSRQTFYSDEVQTMVDQEIRKIDGILKQHQAIEEQAISRRQALVSLASLPLVALLRWRSEPITDTISSEFLSQCAASIAACWHLLRGKGGLTSVDEILPQFMPLLKAFVEQSSKYQKAAAYLAAQASILQGLLAMHRLDFTTREAYCKDAVHYASIAENNNLRAAALTYLGYTYSFCYVPRRLEKAIQIFLEALHIQGKEAPLLRCNIYVGLAEAYAQCKEEQQALRYINLAETNFPAYPEQDPSYIFGACSLHVLYQWKGKMYLELTEHYSGQGYQRKAVDALMKGIGVQSISKFSTTETIIYQADASRVLGELDTYATSLSQAAQMATDLGSRKRYSETVLVYQRTPEKWFRERQIQVLAREVFGQLPNGQLLERE